MSRDYRAMATQIRNQVERTLFDDWRLGNRAIFDCARTVEALIRDLEARLAKVDDFIQKREGVIAELQGGVSKIEANWQRFDLLGALTDSRKRQLGEMARLLREQALARTLIEASRFAKGFIPNILDQLTDLKAALDSAEAALGKSAAEAAREVNARGPVDAKDKRAEGSYITTLEDAQAVEATRRRLLLNEDEQRTQTAQVRAKLLEALGQQPNFALFSRRLTEADIRNIIVSTCEENVRSAHQRLVTTAKERVIEVSILDKLRDRWGDNPETLDRETAALARTAGRFVRFNDVERNRRFDGSTDTPRATECFGVMMPDLPEHKAYADKVKTAFRNARAGAVDFIPTKGRQNEITLVTLVNLFPLRFLTLTAGLKAKYDERIAKVGEARAILEVHTEGDGRSFPALFLADPKLLAAQALVPMMIADGLGLLREGKVGASKRTLTLTRTDADGLDDSVVLGSDFASAPQDMTEPKLNAINAEVRATLAARKIPGDADATDAARTAIIARIEALKAVYGGDVDAADFKSWNTAARTALAVLRGETHF